MATVKVKFRKSTVNGKTGVIYYQLCHKQKIAQLTTNIRLFPHQWDTDKTAVIISDPGVQSDLQACQQRIDNDIILLHTIISNLDCLGKAYSLTDIIKAFRSPDRRISLFTYIEEQIAHLKTAGKLGTARNYRRALSSFSAFLNDHDIPLSLFNEQVILKYDDWLRIRQVVRNTSSFYMRILRAIYNKAVHQHLVNQTFPFQNVYTGVERTRKRAVDEEVIMDLLKLDLSFSPSLSLVRDIFIFSYCTRGMAFVDIAFLQRQSIDGDMITYIRRKTGQRLIIHIEPCISKILQRYTAKNRNSPYIFPILKSIDPSRAFMQYQTALGYYNRRLKQLAKMLGVQTALTSYTSRHTWATTARNHNVPLSIISAGMGHTSEKTTQIYLASLENSVIDQANQSLLAGLNL